MIGWKKGYTIDRGNEVLIKLFIPKDAEIWQPKEQFQKDAGQYCCSKARVMFIISLDGKYRVTCASSMKDGSFKYRIDEMVEPAEDFSIGDSPGIYFFKTKQQAIKYEF